MGTSSVMRLGREGGGGGAEGPLPNFFRYLATAGTFALIFHDLLFFLPNVLITITNHMSNKMCSIRLAKINAYNITNKVIRKKSTIEINTS